MSYILDALKRAESERGRGAVPGLLSQHGASRSDPTHISTSTPAWLLASAAVVLLLLGAGLWRWLAPAALHSSAQAVPSVLAASAQAPTQTSTPAASAPPPTPAPAVAPVMPVPDQPTQPLSRAAVKSVTASAQTTTATATTPTKPTLPAIAAPMAAASTATPALSPPASASPKPAPAPKDNSNVPMLSELPQSLRSQIAAINIAGTVYSESPAQRLLLTETGVFSPGSTVVPGVLLEEILANGAIFNFHGTRFQINH